MRPSLLGAASALPALLALVACGSGGGTLPAPLPCPTPTPSSTAPGTSPVRAYLLTIEEGQVLLRKPTIEFLARWPDRKFSRRQRFREDLAVTVDRVTCVSVALRSLTAPDERFEAFEQTFDAALAGYEADMQIGREAARQRNVSKFRDWLEAVDSFPAILEAVAANLPSR